MAQQAPDPVDVTVNKELFQYYKKLTHLDSNDLNQFVSDQNE